MAAKKTTVRGKRQTKRSTGRRALNKLALPANARIGQAQQLKDDMQALLDRNKPIEIDASSVEKIDTSVMQLLAAFFIKSSAMSVNVSWHSPSDAVRQGASLLGLTGQLNLPDDNAGHST